MTYKAIAFDLDDTLIDTTGVLVPNALKRSYQCLVEAGVNLTTDRFESLRQQMIKDISHRDFFKYIATHFGPQPSDKGLSSRLEEAVLKATTEFYHPELPLELSLLPNVLENITYLNKKYHLYLVTAGFDKAQHQKIEHLNIGHYFKKVFVVDSLKGDKKLNAFREILNIENIGPKNLLCVGNSISSEIHDAIQIGADSCYFEFGEERKSIHDLPEKPTFHIKNHAELISTCKL